ncbi:metallophosphoesterase [Thalassobacillus pellis]|uniref:metallophosphoesterase n=1 Tax=Thalassobacillus pellis TaxID=748008 RepID=UPI0019604BDE|nr:metallophosphoesterase [Thalassobacillus pellis]MBM7555044.1 putative phosphoesterase [Thalassobacillus pellis]
MPRVLIVSDSHGFTNELQQLRDYYVNDVDAMIHCGDSELDHDAKPLEGFYYSKGNVDFDRNMEEEKVFTVGDLTFLVTHGHLYQIKSSLMPLNYRAEEAGADVACFGHSHMAGAEKNHGRLFINPGSCRQPRDHREPTYAILSWQSKADLELQYYNMDHEPIDLRYNTSLLAED